MYHYRKESRIMFFFSSRRRHTRYWRDWNSDVCSSDLARLSGGSVKSRKLFAAPLLLGALSLAACGGGGSTDDGSDPGTDQSAATSTAFDINAQDRGNLAQGGELRLAVGSLAENWNWLHVDGNESDFSDMLEPMQPEFFNFDDKGVPSPNPDFLVSAEVTSTKPTVVHWVLNPKAVWGDGSPIDVDDLTATWKACNGENTKFNCAST